MSDKTFVIIGMTAGSIIGGYIPTLFGASFFSLWSIITSSIGAILGVLVAFRVTQS